jgi:hypothetical protein
MALSHVSDGKSVGKGFYFMVEKLYNDDVKN